MRASTFLKVLAQRFINARIRNKLTLMVMTTLVISALLFYVVNATLIIRNGIRDAHIHLHLLADVAGHNLEAPLSFNDPQSAREVLMSLRANKEIIHTVLSDTSGRIVAQDQQPGVGSKPHGLTQWLPVQQSIFITHAISTDNKMLGALTIQASLANVWQALITQLLQIGFIILTTLAMGIFLAHRLSILIINPIQRISSTARKITRGGDYSLQVEKLADDEVGELAEEFNVMLAEINHRDQALLASRERLDFALQGSNDGLWDWNLENNAIYFSPRWKSMLGYADHELNNNLDTWKQLIDPEVCENIFLQINDYIQGHAPKYEAEFRMRHKDGSWVDILARGKLATSTSNKVSPRRLVGTHMDISERKRNEQELRIAATAFDAQEGMFVTGINGLILRVNQAFTEITGYSADEVVGQTPHMLFSGSNDAAIYATMYRNLLPKNSDASQDLAAEQLLSGRHDARFYASLFANITRQNGWKGEVSSRRKNGEIFPEWLTITAVRSTDNIATHYVGMHTDITKRKAAEDEIKHLAFFDALTQLPNRRLLIDRLQQALVSSARSKRMGALLFVDLDNFKILNDTLGHDSGDLLLKQVADRLTSCVREGDTVARLGGDEFVIMLENLSEKPIEAGAQTEAIGEKILASLNLPYFFASREHRSTASIGITLFNNHEETQEELLKRADIAMYKAKESGRNTLKFFDPKMQTAVTARANLEWDLRRALENNQFIVYFQLQVDQHRQIIGAEALLRWSHPERGMVSPLEFIPLAEDTRQIIPIGRWVLSVACDLIKTWENNPKTQHLQIAVNVSPRQFHQSDFVSQVRQILQNKAIKPDRLKLELTESLVLDDINDTITKMHELRELGVHFSMDDFGTGYSSLAYLSQLPLNQLKIDQSFVRNIGVKSSDSVIVQTIIGMANNLGMQVIAEGVETEEQRSFLEAQGCSAYQGYLFGKPVPLEDFEKLLGIFKTD